jgi:hypothetical protein
MKLPGKPHPLADRHAIAAANSGDISVGVTLVHSLPDWNSRGDKVARSNKEIERAAVTGAKGRAGAGVRRADRGTGRVAATAE